MKPALFVVQDADGNQWLCSSRPELGNDGVWRIYLDGHGRHSVCEMVGCLKLPEASKFSPMVFEGHKKPIAVDVGIQSEAYLALPLVQAACRTAH
jgi:hypothetical protein